MGDPSKWRGLWQCRMPAKVIVADIGHGGILEMDALCAWRGRVNLDPPKLDEDRPCPQVMEVEMVVIRGMTARHWTKTPWTGAGVVPGPGRKATWEWCYVVGDQVIPGMSERMLPIMKDVEVYGSCLWEGVPDSEGAGGV